MVLDMTFLEPLSRHQLHPSIIERQKTEQRPTQSHAPPQNWIAASTPQALHSQPNPVPRPPLLLASPKAPDMYGPSPITVSAPPTSVDVSSSSSSLRSGSAYLVLPRARPRPRDVPVKYDRGGARGALDSRGRWDRFVWSSRSDKPATRAERIASESVEWVE